jgi:hypothetical protein
MKKKRLWVPVTQEWVSKLVPMDSEDAIELLGCQTAFGILIGCET